MKQRAITLRHKIDALTLRERLMVFAAAAGTIIFLAYYAWFDPLLSTEKSLRAQIRQEQDNALGIDAEIIRKVQAYAFDPEAADRARLQAVKVELAQLGAALRAMQRGLVAPDKIAALLETMLKGHGRLRLLSLKTLPVSGLSDGAFELPEDARPSGTEAPQMRALGDIQKEIAGAQAKPAADAKPAAQANPLELVYRHGVEIALQGSYSDMVNYMEALEAMPTQLFWAQAKLDAVDYPAARLTLVLYTLSLDRKWIAL